MRRLGEELGIADVQMEVAGFFDCGVFEYRAALDQGLIEHEIDHVVVSWLREKPVCQPNPNEISDLKWMSPQALDDAISQTPQRYSAWLPSVVNLSRHVITMVDTMT